MSVDMVAKDQLRAFIERIERLEEEKKIIALRRKDEHERLEEEALLDTYMQALGMQRDLFSEAA